MKLKMLNKKYQIALILLAIMLIISGVSYAYFAVTTNGSSNPNIVTSGTMKITFTDGPEVRLDNAIPGDTLTKTFSVTNTGNVSTNYDIYFSELSNNFADQSDLVYSIISNDGGYSSQSDIQIPNTNAKIVSNQSIEVNKTHTYILTIKFLNKNNSQDVNQGKVFNAKISINETHENPSNLSGSGNITTIAYIDGNKASYIPTKDAGYYVYNILCDNSATATWDNNEWGINIRNSTVSGTNCNIYLVNIKISITQVMNKYSMLIIVVIIY